LLGGFGLLLGRLSLVSFIDSSLDLDLTVLINFIIRNIKELLGVLCLLINLGQEECLLHSQDSVNLTNTLVHLFNLGNNGGLLVLQVQDLVVEVDLQLVNGTFKEHHLLTLLLEVDLHVFGDLVIGAHLQVEHAVGGLSLNDGRVAVDVFV